MPIVHDPADREFVGSRWSAAYFYACGVVDTLRDEGVLMDIWPEPSDFADRHSFDAKDYRDGITWHLASVTDAWRTYMEKR